MIFLTETFHLPVFILTFQPILCDVPRLQYVIVVDSKPTSWPDIPRGITIYNIDAVKELGSKPANCKCLCSSIKNVLNLVLDVKVFQLRLNTKVTTKVETRTQAMY